MYFILNFLKIYKRILPKLDNVEPEIIKVCPLFLIVSKQFAWKFKIIGLFDIFWLKIALFVSISIGLWWSPLAAGKHVFQSTYIVSNFRLKNWIERKLKTKRRFTTVLIIIPMIEIFDYIYWFIWRVLVNFSRLKTIENWTTHIYLYDKIYIKVNSRK